VNAIDITNVSKSYPAETGFRQVLRLRQAKREALIDVSMSIRTGECFGLLGLNGAGKTTLLKMISTLLVPDRGSITVRGYDAGRQPAGVRRSIGLCTSDERAFYLRITARENLEFFGRLQQMGRKQLRSRIAELAETVGLSNRLDSRVQTFSTGMRQRLALMRSLLSDPPIVILDEPTKALDPLSAMAFRANVRTQLVQEQGKTVLIATNQLEEAWSTCDRIAILHEHRVAAVGAPADLESEVPAGERAQPLHGYLRHVVGGA
jgi:ABC-2 type transport system ATP-binding protein